MIVNNLRFDFMIKSSPDLQRRTHSTNYPRALDPDGASQHLFEQSPKLNAMKQPTEALLKRMNSAFFRHLMSRKKRIQQLDRMYLCKIGTLPGWRGERLQQVVSGIPDDQFRFHLAMLGGYLAFFEHGFDAFENNAYGGCAHRFHRLPNGGESGRVKR